MQAEGVLEEAARVPLIFSSCNHSPYQVTFCQALPVITEQPGVARPVPRPAVPGQGRQLPEVPMYKPGGGRTSWSFGEVSPVPRHCQTWARDIWWGAAQAPGRIGRQQRQG